jgi:hypothetical protein
MKDSVTFLRWKFIIDNVKKHDSISLKDLLLNTNRWLERLNDVIDIPSRSISERTLKEDVSNIRNILQIPIVSNSRSRKYELRNSDKNSDENYKMLETIQFSAISQLIMVPSESILFSKRKANGLEHFFDLLGAIKSNKKVQFIYHQYEKNEEKKRIVSPLGLKEHKGFWYLVAKEEEIIKTFGLDRISELLITMEKSIIPKDFSLKEYFNYCYGIVRFPDSTPEEIIIKMLPIKYAYYKANPLHYTQELIEKGNNYVIIKINAYFTYDLKQELRSHADGEVEVITPQNGLKGKERYY